MHSFMPPLTGPPLAGPCRLGLYELMEMGAPSHTVNEHVQLAKRVMNTGAGGFANGGWVGVGERERERESVVVVVVIVMVVVGGACSGRAAPVPGVGMAGWGLVGIRACRTRAGCRGCASLLWRSACLPGRLGPPWAAVNSPGSWGGLPAGSECPVNLLPCAPAARPQACCATLRAPSRRTTCHRRRSPRRMPTYRELTQLGWGQSWHM